MEKPRVMVLYNYKVHHAIVFTKLCDILNIDLIYLHRVHQKYNPIEQVWRTIKARISRINIETMNELINNFKKEFYEVVDYPSYWRKWIKTILLDV